MMNDASRPPAPCPLPETPEDFPRNTRWLVKALAVGVFVLLFAPGTRADSTDTVRADIRAALERWTVAFNERDAPGACALFTRDLVATYSGVPDRDYPAMCRHLGSALRDPGRSLRYSFELEEILVSGDLAVVRLVWTLQNTRPGEAAERLVRERGVDVFRRQNGAWKVMRSMAYPMAEDGPDPLTRVAPRNLR
jgi:steroid delta-isomerase